MPQALSKPVRLNLIESTSCTCKVCGGESMLFDVVDFHKVCAEPDRYVYGLAGIPVYYFRCSVCGFIFAKAFDDWSPEQFADYIYNAEYHLVDGDYAERRPQIHAQAIARLLSGHEDLRLLDYGTGSGVFVRHLKELGFANVTGFDPHSFPQRPNGQFDIIFALEVIQHVPHPHRFIDDVRRFMTEGGGLILATALPPADIGQCRGRWMYLAPRNGHISLYAESALLALARRHEMWLCRGEDFFGMIQEGGSPVAEIITERLGAILQSAELGAPPAERESGRNAAVVRTQWHAIETADQVPFRWTKAPAVEWRLASLPAYPARLRVKLPVLMEIVPGFMDRCVVILDGERREVTRSPDGLEADFVVSATGHGHALVLETPEPNSPHELGTTRGDTRKLGLAVRVLREKRAAPAAAASD